MRAGTLATTFEQIVDALRERGCQPKYRRGGESVRSRCPVHEDRDPSFVVTLTAGKILLKCFGNCPQGKLLKAFGLRYADLFDGAGGALPRTKRSIIATYPYSPNVEKVRYVPKAFSWRHWKDGTWHAGFPDDYVPTLYRYDDLAECPRIVLVEGERAVERLWSLGIPATCPPSGASSWPDRLTDALWRTGCHEVAILPDYDQTGRLHAERVAASCYAYVPPADASPSFLEPAPGLQVRIVELPLSITGQDVVDYLDAGHGKADLLDIILHTPYWYPGYTEARRRERRRQQTAARVRRYRAKVRAERDRATCNAPNVRVDRPEACNAPNVREAVTRNAVTHPERSSRYVTDNYRGSL